MSLELNSLSVKFFTSNSNDDDMKRLTFGFNPKSHTT